MKERQYLRKTIRLCGESDGKKFPRTFTITRKISEGASAVCYEAYHAGSGKGILKEFYPQETSMPIRNADGQLVYTEDVDIGKIRFQEAEKRYIEPYESLLQAKRSNAASNLAFFIPFFEIYHGCDENCNIIGTTYIWTPEPELETFDHICDNIHRFPKKDPEHKLVMALLVIESLAKCICELHRIGMIHRDIKPSNFGFVKRGTETLPQTLSMFDIDSVCSVYHVPDTVVGTKGYMEPEAGYERANNQTDIYSIGAVLFQAVIIPKESRKDKYLYCDADYDNLRELVDNSMLIQASESNSHPRLRNILAAILKKCLCERNYRYKNCEELIADIDTALYYALPSDIARKKRSGEQWVLADVEKTLDRNRERNSIWMMQYHLYSNPLYQWSTKEQASLDIMIVGFGNYGQKFLDICLQIGQMRGKELHVAIISDDVADKSLYLDERPELMDFFNIDGTFCGSDEQYGKLTFEIVSLSRDNQKQNACILQNIICRNCENDSGQIPRYIFIALGEDALNLNAAKAVKEAVDILEVDCLVNFAWEGKPVTETLAENLLPVYVCGDPKHSSLYAEIERMGFNVHLVWEKNLNVDYRSVKKDFLKQYNHDSCITNVLSLKYKLYSLGIDMEESGFEEAAGQFIKICLSGNEESKAIRDELIYLEHRRWVTEKLCAGWKRIRNLEECLSCGTRDQKHKRHVCIVKSRPKQNLSMDFYNTDGYAKWDNASDAELGKLDELDRMSVRLHRVYKIRAEEIKRQNLINENVLEGIRILLKDHKKAMIAFQEWSVCWKDIWNGSAGKVWMYKGLKEAFLKEADSLPVGKKESVKAQMKAFDALFYPIIASMEYRDYKQKNTALIDNIPFVLTYSDSVCMAIPYMTGNNTALFSNVASATVVNPAKIIYLCYLKEKNGLDEIKKSITYIIEYMQKKRLRASIEFIMAYTDGAAPYTGSGLCEEMKRLGEGRIGRIQQLFITDERELPDMLTKELTIRARGRRMFAVEKNEAQLSYLLKGSGFYDKFNNYQFDSVLMKFSSSANCAAFGYIQKKPYITVTDMLAFRKSIGESSRQPEFFEDYKELWSEYNKDNKIWKKLCSLLDEYSKGNDVLAVFAKSKKKLKEVAEYCYILPSTCHLSADKIINFLIAHNIVEMDSRVNGFTTDSCEVIIRDKYGHQEICSSLFANVYALMAPDTIDMKWNAKEQKAVISFDNLIVSGVQITDKNSGNIGKMIELLRFFDKRGYIIHLTQYNGRVSFTYATAQIKKLLTCAGKMLEVYTYHNIKETGIFDDVVSSYEVEWEKTEVRNEFDCILTLGFSVIFVECKAQSDIKAEFYYKLAELAKQFGINAKAVLVADTREKWFYNNAKDNEMQRKRGNMMDVVTIWDKDEINHIGQTLWQVIQGTYRAKE